MQMPTKSSSDNKFLNTLLNYSTQLYIGWVFFIALLMFVPGKYVPTISWNFLSIDKTVHISVFAVLTILALLGSNYGKLKLFPKYPVLLSTTSAIIYGYSIELIQSFIPERSYDFADFTADCVGTVVGYGLFIGMLKILHFKQ